MEDIENMLHYTQQIVEKIKSNESNLRRHFEILTDESGQEGSYGLSSHTKQKQKQKEKNKKI